MRTTRTCNEARPRSRGFTDRVEAARNCERQTPSQGFRISLISGNKVLACGFGGALGGTRTPNLLIRRLRQVIQDRSSWSMRWADIPQLSTRDQRYPAAWQQYWQQSRWTSLNRSPGHPASTLGRLPSRPIAEIPTGFNHLRPTFPATCPQKPCCVTRFSTPAKAVPRAILPGATVRAGGDGHANQKCTGAVR